MAGFRIKRIYEPPARSDGTRILVDRIWPRGVSKDKAALDRWAKELAPSTALRKWFNHDPERWDEFRRRYAKELETEAEALESLRAEGAKRAVTLLYSAKDTAHNQAAALRDILEAPPERGG